MTLKKRLFLSVVLVMVVAGFFRFFKLDWDAGHHLHPDERFLTMVTLDLRWSESIYDYFDSGSSTLNPANVGHEFFVYGSLPLVMVKFLAEGVVMADYDGIAMVGRAVVASLDTLLAGIVVGIGVLLGTYYGYGLSLGLFAGLSYGLYVVAIQQAHFYTVDTFMVVFGVGAVFLGLIAAARKRGWWWIGAGVLFGLSVASKINAVFFGPLLLWLLVFGLDDIRNWSRQLSLKKGIADFSRVFLWVAAVYVTVRVASPGYFASPLPFNPMPAEQFLTSIEQLKAFENEEAWYPPAVQWLNKAPVVYSLQNMAVHGLGIPLFLLVMIGMGLWIFSARVWRQVDFRGVLLLWVVGLFLYQSSAFVKALRYFMPMYPVLALFSGLALWKLWEMLLRLRLQWGMIIVALLAFWWPMAFLSIYIQPVPRIAASEWLYERVKTEDGVLFEYWDDPLPLRLEEYSNYPPVLATQLPVFDFDTVAKWREFEQLFLTHDYYVLSSNRGWASMTDVPWRYPNMSEYYLKLFAGETDYKLVADFRSYPSLTWLGIPWTMPDDYADETFSVYDHPRVLIYGKSQ